MEAHPTLSGRLIRPFARVLARYPSLERTAGRLRKVHSDARIQVRTAYGAIARWMAKSGDDDLGLNAALETEIGCAGLLDYAMRSAGCVQEAFRLAHDYAWYFSESLQIDWVLKEHQTIVHLVNSPSPPRGVSDFTLGTWFRNYLRPQLEELSSIGCHFSYEAPPSTDAHRLVFTNADLHFDAGFDGFSFDSRILDRPLVGSSPWLHALHCELLESRAHALSHRTVPIATRVRWLIARNLRHGRPSEEALARKLRMSRRTLVRRLAAEGTTYTALVMDVRRTLALRFACMESLPIAEIAGLLGFSHTQAFCRRFKHWTGLTPVQYRKAGRVWSS